MLLIISKDQTLPRHGLSELLVIMTKYDDDVNFQAIDHRDKFFMERRVWAPRTCHPHMAFVWRLLE